MSGPLEGVLVVSFELVLAAPLCTRHLADLGARVIKVESIGLGDSSRQQDDAVRGLGASFCWLNRNKESLAIDLKAEQGKEAIRRLLARADVVVQNLAPGAAQRLGVDAPSVVSRHERAIAVDISGYGEGGPLSQRRAYDLLVQSEAGSCAVTGHPGAPAKPGIPIADCATGLYAFSAVLTALYDRQRTGRGAAISVGMFDVVAELMGWAINRTRYTGEVLVPQGVGSPMVAPYAAYPTSDGQTVVLGTTADHEWQRLATQLIDRPDLAADPRLATNVGRTRERGIIDEAIADWTSQRPLEEVQQRAEQAGLGHARLNGVPELIDHVQLSSRNRWREVDSPVGPIPALLPPPVSSTWEARFDPIPALGEHTDAILVELGYSSDQIARLRATGVV